MRVPLNKRRLGVVDAAFSSMASASAGSATAASAEKDGDDAATVSLVEAVERMNPEGHPEVAAGRLGPQEVRYGSVCDVFHASGHQVVSLRAPVLTSPVVVADTFDVPGSPVAGHVLASTARCRARQKA